MKKLIIGVGTVGLVLAGLGGVAAARSVAAHTGSARVGTQASSFSADFGNGVVTNVGTVFADYLVPLTTDTPGNKNLTFTSRATAAGGQCRAISANRFGTGIQATGFQPIPVNAAFQTFTFAAINVPAQGVFLADCITNPGSALAEFDYVP